MYHHPDHLQSLLDRGEVTADQLANFKVRFTHHWPELVKVLKSVYAERPDLPLHLDRLQMLCCDRWAERSPSLKLLDDTRPAESLWYNDADVVGASLYVDLFAETLSNLETRLEYLVDLGVNYVHLMPIFLSPEGNSDGGYAVSDFRVVNPELGEMESLRALSDAMRARGISLVLDFIFNHTSDEHEWALRAKRGEARYLNFYRTFDSRELVDAYQAHLRDIFPTIRRGSFSWSDDLNRWVWTSFNSFQWDLNYDNPEVFVCMVDELIYLANCGVDVLRLDAVAFIWKRLGTDCENLPEAHRLIRAFNHVCRIVAPAVVFKSEAIVHPDDVRSYIGAQECQLSYNPNLMALLWEATATRQTKLLERALSHRQVLDPETTWVNYLRCHDDIGWCFDDGDARAVGIDPFGHRLFLNAFYSGQFKGSFARGVPFQYNPVNQDMRICGTLASLVGIEEALTSERMLHLEMALARARMLFGVLMSIGGIPLIYLGEELGILNDYAYQQDPDQRDDSRWVHRTVMDWSRAPGGDAHYGLTAEFYAMVTELITARKRTAAISGTQIEILSNPSPHLLAFRRPSPKGDLIVLANFSEQELLLPSRFFARYALTAPLRDLLSTFTLKQSATLAPYALHWFQR